MNRKYFFTGLAAAFTLFTTLPAGAELPVNIGIANTRTQEVDVRNFNAVAAGGPIQVIITLGDTEGLRFEGDAEAISTLITEVKGTALIIRPKMSWTSWAHKYKDKKVIAYVNAKTIGSLTMSGDGNITVKGTIKQTALTTTLSGSGFITAKVGVDLLTAVISGSGKLNISGEANTSDITISGSGSIAKNLTLKVENNVSVRISGSGSVYVHTDGDINAMISGSGNVYYRGDAEVSQKKFGSGSVRKF